MFWKHIKLVNSQLDLIPFCGGWKTSISSWKDDVAKGSLINLNQKNRAFSSQSCLRRENMQNVCSNQTSHEATCAVNVGMNTIQDSGYEWKY